VAHARATQKRYWGAVMSVWESALDRAFAVDGAARWTGKARRTTTKMSRNYEVRGHVAFLSGGGGGGGLVVDT